MKELLKIAAVVLVALVVYDMFVKKLVVKSSYEDYEDFEE